MHYNNSKLFIRANGRAFRFIFIAFLKKKAKKDAATIPVAGSSNDGQ